MDYTLAQFNAYLRLAAQREKESRRWFVLATATATGGGKPLQDMLKALK